jgi:hypothetical protein
MRACDLSLVVSGSGSWLAAPAARASEHGHARIYDDASGGPACGAPTQHDRQAAPAGRIWIIVSPRPAVPRQGAPQQSLPPLRRHTTCTTLGQSHAIDPNPCRDSFSCLADGVHFNRKTVSRETQGDFPRGIRHLMRLIT